MPENKKPNYFQEIARVEMRKAELSAWHFATTITQPILEVLEAQTEQLKRIADAVELLAKAYEMSLGNQGLGVTGRPAQEPASSPEFEPMYQDELGDAMQEQVAASAREMPRGVAALYGEEEQRQWTPEK